MPQIHDTDETTPGTAAAALPAWVRVPATGSVILDGLLAGTAWDASGPLTYAFPDSPLDYESPYGGDSAEPSGPGFAQASFEQQKAIRYILEGASPFAGGPVMRHGAFEAVADLDFRDIGTGGDALLRFATTDAARAGSGGTAHAYYPGDPVGGDIWFGDAYAGTFQDYRTPVPGNFAWLSHLHEIGHALGLKHPHADAALPPALDSLELSVMSYRSYPGAPIDPEGYHNAEFGYPQTLMALDIQALQHLYGPNWTTNDGDTRYGWDAATGEMLVDGLGQGRPGVNRVFLTVWDGGGDDTYDLSNYTGSVSIDLRPGAWSVTSDAQRARLQHAGYGQEVLARGNVYNALPFGDDPRSLIENAIGGAGNDAITGNDAANRLRGGAGNDALLGGAGDDVVAGEAGDDVLAARGTTASSPAPASAATAWWTSPSPGRAATPSSSGGPAGPASPRCSATPGSTTRSGGR